MEPKSNVANPPALTSEQAQLLLKADLANLTKKVKAGKTLSVSERNLLQSALAGETPSPVEYAKNAVELAAILGVERKTIQRWRKLEGNPGVEPDGRYHVPAWRAFKAKRNGEDGDGVPLSQSQLKAEQILLQNQKLEFQLAILRREYVAAIDVEKWVGEMIGNAKKKLFSGPPSLAPQVVGVTIPEAEKLLREWINDALSQLHEAPLGKEVD